MKTLKGTSLDYQQALEAAGAIVHAYEMFGSYQGDWWAKVTLPDGRNGFVRGSYGSCSGCDALQNMFGYSFGKEDWDANVTVFTDDEYERIVDFGRGELEEFYPTLEAAKVKASENIAWDMEAHKVVAWLEAQDAK